MISVQDMKRRRSEMGRDVRAAILAVLEDQISALGDAAGLYAIGNPERRKRIEFIADILVSRMSESPVATAADVLIEIAEAALADRDAPFEEADAAMQRLLTALAKIKP